MANLIQAAEGEGETVEKITEAIVKANIKGENHPMFGITGENHPLFGKHHSAETIKKMSIAHKGQALSEETKEKISLIKGTKIYVYSSNNVELINTFNSARKAAEFFSVSKDTIIKYAKTEQIFQDKWNLSYTLK